MRFSLIVLAILFSLLRLTVDSRPTSAFTWQASYEALVHVVTGMILAAWIITKEHKTYGTLFLLINAVELACFFLQTKSVCP